jgi:hypothetical protein
LRGSLVNPCREFCPLIMRDLKLGWKAKSCLG